MRFVLLVLLAGCKSLSYQCETDTECGTGGACEATRFCSFADSACSSGRRYGEWAGNSLGGKCVDDVTVDAPGGADARPPDAPPNAITKTFGETGTATHANVTSDVEITIGSMANFGTADHASIDNNTAELGLYRFDISVIPTSATVVSAKVELATYDAGSVLTMGKVQVFRMLETWDETVATSFARSAAANWSDPGVGTPTSRDPTVIGEFQPTVVDRFTVDLPKAMVQSWVTDPATNAGIAVVDQAGNTGHCHLATRENATAAARALLVVTYVP